MVAERRVMMLTVSCPVPARKGFWGPIGQGVIFPGRVELGMLEGQIGAESVASLIRYGYLVPVESE